MPDFRYVLRFLVRGAAKIRHNNFITRTQRSLLWNRCIKIGW
jgi:hypothetical protein